MRARGSQWRPAADYRWRMARLPALLLTLAAGLLLGGCTTESPPDGGRPTADPPTPDPTPPVTDDPIRMAAVGDSITDADSPDFVGGEPGAQSWVSYAVGPRVEFVGGWAEWGAPISQMADAVRHPIDADVLVILAGTNDAGWTPPDEFAADLSRLVDNAAVEHVVLSSVPPTDFGMDATSELNAHLESLAARHDWTWVDAAAGLRDGDRYSEGMSYDGVHPSEAGARVLGEAIGAAVIAAAAS